LTNIDIRTILRNSEIPITVQTTKEEIALFLSKRKNKHTLTPLALKIYIFRGKKQF